MAVRPKSRRGGSEVKDYTRCPEGIFIATIIGQRFGLTDKAGTPFIAFEIVPTHKCDPVYPNDDSKAEEVTVVPRESIIYLSEKTIGGNGMAIKSLRSLGWEGTRFSELDPDSPNFVDLSGTTARFRCKHDVYNGGKNDKWEVVVGRAKPPEDKTNKKGVAAQLDAIFGADLAQFPVSGKSSPKPTAKPAVQPKTVETEPTQEEDEDNVFGPGDDVEEYDEDFGDENSGEFDIPF